MIQALKVATVQVTRTFKRMDCETEIIDWIWLSYWCGTDAAQYQRASPHRLVSDKDASLGPVVPMAKPLLEVLRSSGRPRIASLTLNSQGVRFSHEVAGDRGTLPFVEGQGSERHSQISWSTSKSALAASYPTVFSITALSERRSPRMGKGVWRTGPRTARTGMPTSSTFPLAGNKLLELDASGRR